MDQILYVKINQNTIVYDRQVKFRDFATFYSGNSSVIKKIEDELFYTLPVSGDKKTIFSVNKVYEKIHALYPKLQVENIGETDFIIELREKEKENKLLEYGKTVIVALVSFFGAAFTVMTFNQDVSVEKVFDKVYLSVMGTPKQGGSALELCYAIGLPVGILIFYNHFRHKKIKEDPTPIQVEMNAYEQQVNRTIIEASDREGTTVDAN